jgi:hypothetical protein
MVANARREWEVHKRRASRDPRVGELGNMQQPGPWTRSRWSFERLATRGGKARGGSIANEEWHETRVALHYDGPQSSEASGHRVCCKVEVDVASRQSVTPPAMQLTCSRRLLSNTRSPTSAPSGVRPCLQICLHVERLLYATWERLFHGSHAVPYDRTRYRHMLRVGYDFTRVPESKIIHPHIFKCQTIVARRIRRIESFTSASSFEIFVRLRHNGLNSK